MSALFNKKDADEQVIEVLLRELNRRSKMSKYFKEGDTIYEAVAFEEVSQEELQARLDELNAQVAEVNNLLNPAAPADVPAPSEPPVAAEAPAAPEQPIDAVPAEQPAEAPAEPAAEPVQLQ